MRIDLKSLMILAHSIKSQYRVTMREAMQVAWAKAKGFNYASCVSLSTGRVWLYAYDLDTAYAERIAFVNKVNATRFAPIRSDVKIYGSHGPSRIMVG